MKLGECFPSKWLKAADADDEPLTLTITRVEFEEFKEDGGTTKDKLVARFDETDKGLVLNVTNAKTIGAIYGDDTDDWIGRRIVLISTEVQFGSDMVPALRVSKKGTEGLAKKKAAQPAGKPSQAVPAKTARSEDADDLPDDEADLPY